MLFFFALGMSLLFMICGLLIYRLGIHDGNILKHNGNVKNFFEKSKDNIRDEDWSSIINYDHKKER